MSRVVQGTFWAGVRGSRVAPDADLSPRGPGMVLPETLRRDLEAFFTTDFSSVRVHIDQRAAQLGASAVTAGTNIFFAPGRYEPATQRGLQLLARELVHVMQQRGGIRNPFGNVAAIFFDARLEAEADRLSAGAVRMLSAKNAARPLAVVEESEDEPCCDECEEGAPCAGTKVPTMRSLIRVFGSTKIGNGKVHRVINGKRVNPPRKSSEKQKKFTKRQMKKMFDHHIQTKKSKTDECKGNRPPSKWGWKKKMWDGDSRPGWSVNATNLLPGNCQICGNNTAATCRDHIVPYRKYISDNASVQLFCDGTCHYLGVSMADASTWSNDLDNLRPLCTNCNSTKGVIDKKNPQNVAAPPTLVGPCPSSCPTCKSICL